MSTRVLRAALVAAALAVPAWSQTPLGSEFRVNSHTTSAQGVASVARAANGGFVVAWQSYGQDGSLEGVFAQRYDASGTPLGPELPVNSHTTDRQKFPAVASDSAGNFVVVWQSQGQDGSGYGVFAQRFSAEGARRGIEFQVNSFTTGEQQRPAVASDQDGNIVVVWDSLGQDGHLAGVFGRRFTSSGAPRGLEFQVNLSTANTQYAPDVATDATGNFVVVWAAANQDGNSFAVVGQRFDAAGSRLGYEFLVNSYVTGSQRSPAVSSDPSGNFVVVWQSYPQDGNGWGVFGQRHLPTGARQGPEFHVSSQTAGDQYLASVAAEAGGSFLVAWTAPNEAGTSREIFGQRFGASGGGGAELRINAYTNNAQSLPAVAAIGNGNFVVVWGSYGQDLSGYGVFGQRLSTNAIFRDGFE
jgi:hypothetical protein